MIDVVGAITLTLVFALLSASLILVGRVPPAMRLRLAGAALTWFALIGALAALGLFGLERIGTIAVGVAVLAPVVFGGVVVARSAVLREAVLTLPLPLLIGVHGGRLLGIFFVLLYSAGRLPPTFALSAGWGDIAVGALAPVVAWAVYQRVGGWRGLVLIWNAVGLVDLVTAVTLGVGSAPNSPARFIFETPNSGTIASLPWVLIPGLLVPLYLLTHIAIFVQLARRDHREPVAAFLAEAVPVLADSRNPAPPRARRTYRGSGSHP
jgi:hypothetical protein